MFLGEYSHALNAKGRLTIPAQFRDALQEGLVLAPGDEACIAVYPVNLWAELAARVAQLPLASRAARAYSRQFFGRAFEVVPDKMGRIVIPNVLRKYAGIEEEAVVIGANTYLEVWNPERWCQIQQRDAENLEMILEDVARMGV